ncbi:MAG: hypothetical protein KC636_13725 [Myxococcales bacterium]|nr:hypothetical protein [Myxococcales bacterium]
MRRAHRFFLTAFAAATLVACGTPAERDGQGDTPFGRAGMGGKGGHGGSNDKGVAVEPISWLVTFNRLQSPGALEEAINKKPGQFSSADMDGDGAFDYIDVLPRTHDRGSAFELRARPRSGAENNGPVVATLLFDDEWGFIGSYNGAMPGLPPDPATASAGPSAASARAGDRGDLAKGLAIEPISWLVRFNKLHSPTALAQAINASPGKFSHIDANGDGLPDPVSISERNHSKGRAFEVSAHPDGEGKPGSVVATIVFDDEWEMVGWYSGSATGATSTAMAAP